MVTEGGPHIWAIVNAVADRLGPVTVILETPESKAKLLRRRAARQGWFNVAGQVGTMMLTRLGKRFLAGRAEKIVAENRVETGPRPGQAGSPPVPRRARQHLRPPGYHGSVRPSLERLACVRLPAHAPHPGEKLAG